MAKRKTTTSSNGNGRLSLPVQFGDVGIGDKTARISVGIDRGRLEVQKADASFCGKRITGELILSDGNPDQQTLPGIDADPPPRMTGVADVKQLTVTRKKISCTLSFALESIDVAALSRFAKRQGTLALEHVQPIPEGEPQEEDEEEDLFDKEQAEQPAKRGRRQKAEADPQAWRSLDLGVLEDLNDQTKHALTEAGLATLGELTDYRAKNASYAGVKNIGPKKAGIVEKAVAGYFQRVKVTRQLLGQTAEAVAAPE